MLRGDGVVPCPLALLGLRAAMLQPLEIRGVFTPGECLCIVAAARNMPSDEAGLVGGLRADNMRRSRVVWLDEEGECAWVFRRLLDTFAEANRAHFAFALEEFGERMQVAWYEADTGGFFDWHVDCGDGPTAARRKLTMVVQLSDGEN